MKELLEKAAKACGIHDQLRWENRDVPMWKKYSGGDRLFWNPAVEDGDSARLADALMISVRHEPQCVLTTWIQKLPGISQIESLADHNNSRAAARRMAVLKLAAMIGDGV